MQCNAEFGAKKSYEGWFLRNNNLRSCFLQIILNKFHLGPYVPPGLKYYYFKKPPSPSWTFNCICRIQISSKQRIVGKKAISLFLKLQGYQKVFIHLKCAICALLHTERNCFNLFQISFSSNAAYAHPGVSGVSKDQKFCEKFKNTHCQVDHPAKIE